MLVSISPLLQIPFMLFDFNLYSSLLLIFFVHGLVYGGLFLIRWVRTGLTSDCWMGIFLLLCVLYIFPWMTGFAGWYNQQPYRDFLFYMPFQHLFFIGPVVFFYTQSLLNPGFRFTPKEGLHFVPGLLYILFSIVMVVTDKIIAKRDIFLADGMDPDFDTWYQVSGFISMILYVYLSFRYYIFFRRIFVQVSSFADRFHFTHIRNYLLAFAAMLLLRLAFFVVGLFFNLNYIGSWWYFLGFAILFYYIAIAGFGTRPQIKIPYKLAIKAGKPVYLLTYEHHEPVEEAEYLLIEYPTEKQLAAEPNAQIELVKEKLLRAMKEDHLFEDPDLTLSALAKALGTNVSILSKTVNSCFGQNFNDFINGYRVNAVKESFLRREQIQTSLEGIGYRNGFNSKATFFRSFKKHTGKTPAEYLKYLSKTDA